MADDFTFTEGAGKTGAADDVSGVLFAKVKLDLGTDGVSAPALAGTGIMATGVQRVTLATDDPATVLLGTIDGDTGAIKTAVELIDNAISGSEMQVDVITVPAPLNIIGGGAEAAALRVTLANDSTGVITVDGTVTANLSATDNAVLDVIAGDTTSIDGKITACNTGAVVISSGTVTANLGATDNAVLDQIELNTDPLLVVGGGAEATAIRVTIANDSTGVITVDGTVTANLSATDNAVLDAIAASLVTIDADTGAIKLATEIIDDWDATHASAAPADGVCIMGAGYSAGLPTDVGADADAARICTDRHGRILGGVMPQNFQATFTSADAQAATPVKTKTADRKMYILSLVVSVDTAMNVQFQDDTGPTVLIEGMYFAANGGAHLTWPSEAPLVVNTNEDFDVITSAAGNISVTITGYLAV